MEAIKYRVVVVRVDLATKAETPIRTIAVGDQASCETFARSHKPLVLGPGTPIILGLLHQLRVQPAAGEE